MLSDPSLQTAFAILRLTMQQPLGLISVLLFLGGIAAFLIFRDLNPKASVTSFWFVLIGCIGLAYEASETMRLNPDLTRFRRAALVAAPSPDARPVAPSPTSRSQAVRPDSARAVPGGSSAASPPSGGSQGGSGGGLSAAGGGPASAGPTNAAATSAPAGGQPDQRSGSTDGNGAEQPQTFSSIRWTTDRIVTEDRVTGNHKCADVPGAVNPRACKTGYTIALTCDAGKRLTSPQLHCIEGDCAASMVSEIRTSPDGRRVDARFEVWGAPTRWQLTAVREESVESN